MQQDLENKNQTKQEKQSLRVSRKKTKLKIVNVRKNCKYEIMIRTYKGKKKSKWTTAKKKVRQCERREADVKGTLGQDTDKI